MEDTVSAEVLGLTAQIVVAHVSHNPVAADALPAMIQSVYRSLASAGAAPEAAPAAAAAAPIPAVAIKKSVFPDFIVCLEDGKKLKMLKRHLRTSYNLTPADYRAKWGLPSDYPMTAPNYTSTRSQLAKSIGLGRKPSIEAGEPEAIEPNDPDVTRAPARRARGSKG